MKHERRWSAANEEAVGPDGIHAELLELGSVGEPSQNPIPYHFHSTTATVWTLAFGMPQAWKNVTIRGRQMKKGRIRGAHHRCMYLVSHTGSLLKVVAKTLDSFC